MFRANLHLQAIIYIRNGNIGALTHQFRLCCRLDSLLPRLRPSLLANGNFGPLLTCNSNSMRTVAYECPSRLPMHGALAAHHQSGCTKCEQLSCNGRTVARRALDAARKRIPRNSTPYISDNMQLYLMVVALGFPFVQLRYVVLEYATLSTADDQLKTVYPRTPCATAHRSYLVNHDGQMMAEARFPSAFGRDTWSATSDSDSECPVNVICIVLNVRFVLHRCLRSFHADSGAKNIYPDLCHI